MTFVAGIAVGVLALLGLGLLVYFYAAFKAQGEDET